MFLFENITIFFYNIYLTVDGSVEEGLGKKRMMRDSNGRGKKVQNSS